MIISCPRCDTSFSLPDELYKPGKKARCSSCGFIFAMPEVPGEPVYPESVTVVGETAPTQAQEPTESSSRARKLRLLSILVTIPLVLLLIYGAYLILNAYMLQPDSSSTAGQATAANATVAASSDQSAHDRLISSITLDEIKQFLADNLEVGKVMVIQGYVVNNSEYNTDNISIEARILDENNRVLAKVQQLCGVPLSLFQLQSLSEKALHDSLNSRSTIAMNNTNVGPGGRVPFVVVFPNPPESMRTYEVQVVDVRESLTP